MGERIGSWIDHDGKGFPFEIVKAEIKKGAFLIGRFASSESGVRIETPWEQANLPKSDPDNPGWSWSWKGGIFRRRRRVCVDPEYRPFVKYRFHYREDGQEKSEQVEMLKLIAKGELLPASEQEDKEAEMTPTEQEHLDRVETATSCRGGTS